MARGAVFGLTRGRRKRFHQSNFTGIAYQVRDILGAMEEDTGIDIPVLKVDGGAANNDYLMQFQADILNTPVQRAGDLETTALGAAFLAGLAVGYWQDFDEIKAVIKDGKRFEVQMDDKRRNKLYGGWQKAVTATRYFE